MDHNLGRAAEVPRDGLQRFVFPGTTVKTPRVGGGKQTFHLAVTVRFAHLILCICNADETRRFMQNSVAPFETDNNPQNMIRFV
jgi:hypothetical protein